MHARVALVLSLALAMVVGALTLAHSPLRVVRVGAKSEESLATTTGSATVCQAGETLPGGVSALRIGMEASFGPKVLVRAYSGSRILTAGSRTGDWTSSSVTVSVEPLEGAVSPVTLCLYVPANSERLQLYGTHSAAGQAARVRGGQALPGRVSVEYLAPGGGSWWSRAMSVARHIGIGHAIGGTWVALLLAALVVAVSGLMIGLAWRELP